MMQKYFFCLMIFFISHSCFSLESVCESVFKINPLEMLHYKSSEFTDDKQATRKAYMQVIDEAKKFLSREEISKEDFQKEKLFILRMKNALRIVLKNPSILPKLRNEAVLLIPYFKYLSHLEEFELKKKKKKKKHKNLARKLEQRKSNPPPSKRQKAVYGPVPYTDPNPAMIIRDPFLTVSLEREQEKIAEKKQQSERDSLKKDPKDPKNKKEIATHGDSLGFQRVDKKQFQKLFFQVLEKDKDVSRLDNLMQFMWKFPKKVLTDDLKGFLLKVIQEPFESKKQPLRDLLFSKWFGKVKVFKMNTIEGAVLLRMSRNYFEDSSYVEDGIDLEFYQSDEYLIMYQKFKILAVETLKSFFPVTIEKFQVISKALIQVLEKEPHLEYLQLRVLDVLKFMISKVSANHKDILKPKKTFFTKKIKSTERDSFEKSLKEIRSTLETAYVLTDFYSVRDAIFDLFQSQKKQSFFKLF